MWSSLLPFILVGLQLISQADGRLTYKVFPSGNSPLTRREGVPYGAHLVQLRTCANIPYTIPALVNDQWRDGNQGQSWAKVAYISLHGADRKLEPYYNAVAQVVDTANSVIIQTGFYSTEDQPGNDNFYDAENNLAWEKNRYAYGYDAVSPSGSGACSSFNVLDTIIETLSNKQLYPGLQRIVVVGHSAGGNQAGRYSMLGKSVPGAPPIRYVVANPATMPYFNYARPHPKNDCPPAYRYPDQFVSGSYPRYVTESMACQFGDNGEQVYREWMKKDVVLMTGALDTYNRYHFGSQSCSAQSQGGVNRRDRNYHYWSYVNLLAGRDEEASHWEGYQHFKRQGVHAISDSSNFHIQQCTVRDAGHNEDQMYRSQCGRDALNSNGGVDRGPGNDTP